MIVYIEFVSWDEDDFYGKVVARSDVRGMSQAEIDTEIAAMRRILGAHVTARYVEEV